MRLLATLLATAATRTFLAALATCDALLGALALVFVFRVPGQSVQGETWLLRKRRH